MYLRTVNKRSTLCRGMMAGVACFGLVLLAPQTASAQVDECQGFLEVEALGGPVYLLGDPVRISATMGAGNVTGGTPSDFVQINEFTFFLDCSEGDAFPTCTDGGNTVSFGGDGTITTTCEDSVPQTVSFTTTQVGDEVTFTPSAPIQTPANTTCNVQFDVVVEALGDDNTIVEILGFADAAAECSNGQPVNLASTLSFDISSQGSKFRVMKDFSDDNPAGIEAYIECNTGLPLEQNQTISEFGDVGFDHVDFVVVAYDSGELTCSIFEDPVPEGYTESYSAGTIDGIAGTIEDDAEGCHFIEVEEGSFTCLITDTLDPVEILVTKEWFGDLEAAGIFDTDASADWTCSNVRSSPTDTSLGEENGSLYFNTNPDTDSTGSLYPDYGGTSVCTVEENVVDSAVESDDSDCESLPIAPGMGNSCTITNLVFVEGIPTLSQYGLAVLALLMLGVGLVGFRRFA